MHIAYAFCGISQVRRFFLLLFFCRIPKTGAIFPCRPILLKLFDPTLINTNVDSNHNYFLYV